MDPATASLLVVLLLTALLALLERRRRRPNPLDLMPGPPRRPVVGNLLQIDMKHPHLTMTEWSLKYGPVYRVRMGILGDVVVVCGQQAVKEALMDRELAGRPRTFRAGIISNKYRNVGFGDPTNPEWKPLRNAVRKEIKATDAAGLRRLETATLDAMDELAVDIMRQGQNGKLAFNVREILYIATLNIICEFLVAARYSKTDREFQLFEKMERIGVTLVSSAGGGGAELDAFPWLRHFGHPVCKLMREYEQLLDELYRLMKNRAEQQADTSADGAGENPLIYTLHKIVEAHLESDAETPFFTDEHIKGTFSDLIMGGTASTTNLTYALLNVLLHDRVIYRRLKDELEAFRIRREELVGVGGSAVYRITLNDRPALPYTQATVLELLRYVSIAAFAVPHKALSDTKLNGLDIPSETEVIINLWSVHHEESFWKDSLCFNPDRFLTPDRQSLHPPEHPARRHLIPFGAGQRRCIGEAFALSRLFLIVANLISDFDVLAPNDNYEDLVTCDPRTYELGIASYPMDFTVRLEPTESCFKRHPDMSR